MLLARLAVDERVAGRGVGRQLLVHALAGAAEASHHVGFDVVVVHAIDLRCHVMTTKTERLNLRCSTDALRLIREAAEAQGQDLTSFVMGAAIERARAVIAEDRVLRTTPAEVLQLERALDDDARPSPQLAALIRGVRERQRI